MFKSFLEKFKKTEVRKVAEHELKQNMGVITSLRDYDQGKKEISTTNIERRLPNIRVAR